MTGFAASAGSGGLARGAAAETTGWRALRYFNIYRLVLTGLFSVFVLTRTLPPPLGAVDHELFAVVVLAYFAGTVAMQVFIEQRYATQIALTYALVVLDTAAVVLMMFSSGGVTSGLGMLLVVTIVGASILATGRHALAFAAIASIAVLGEEIYAAAVNKLPVVNYTQAGLLGITFFAASLLAYVSARRVRESEALARQRAAALASLERLNEHIVQRMRSGILAIDSGERVRLMNASAARLLGTGHGAEGQPLADLLPEIGRRYEMWRADGRNISMPIRGRGADLTVAFSALGAGGQEGALVFLEDDAMLRQRAQQLKLASLGRLVASIAHEIRNPLGAISHAAQLLEESDTHGREDQRLTEIIRDHAQRVNAIVENVMNLARREMPVPEAFELRPWLEGFVREFLDRHDLGSDAVTVAIEPRDLTVRMDRGQCRQVLWNLCENALRYSRGAPLIELRGGTDERSGRPFLDVVDHGTGIAGEFVERIFEPFATTEAKGTGLGLYIANELCEANQASLRLEANTPGGCRFRINFAHPARQQLTEG
ncbi:MAG: Adaptive-response sensory-kinase SasA [Gammaproteobacteria bacterium]|nr:Adaptive-response sensory-kinase SasA [Gammaproteobacteria bacterium]